MACFKHHKTLTGLSESTIYRLILLTASLVLLPAVFTGLMGDDLLHYMMINGAVDLPERADFSLFNLFSFISTAPEYRLPYMGVSLIPWWTGSEFSWNFWRPLSELTHYLDYRWFGDHFWLMHLQSMGYFLLLLVLLKQVLDRLFMASKPALLALALFGLNCSHGITVAWLSNRHAILAATAVIATLIMHDSYRKTQQSRYWLLACMALLAALFAGESGLCAGVWVFSYAVFIDKGSVRVRAMSLLPYFVIAVVWLYLYRLGGFGVSGYSTFYIDPFATHWAFIQNYVTSLPKAVLSQVFIIPSDVLVAVTEQALVNGLGYLVLAGLLIATIKVREKALYGFFMGAFLLTLFPVASSQIQDRNLIQVSIAGSGILAILMVNLYRYLQTARDRHRLVKSCLVLMVVLHFVFSPLLLMVLSYSPALFSAAGAKRANTLSLKDNREVVIFKGDMMECVYLYPNLVKQRKPLPERLWNLGGHAAELTVKAVNAHQVIVESAGPYFSKNDLMARDIINRPFVEGQRIDLDGLVITVKAVTPTGQPQSLMLDFTRPLSEVNFYLWRQSGYEKLDLPEGLILTLPADR